MWIVAAIALLPGLPGCSATLPAYAHALDEWTRDARVYEHFESRIFVDATLKTEAFRREYVKEYARIFSLDEAQQKILLDSEIAEHQDSFVLMLGVFTHEIAWDNLDPKKGIWEVRLENEKGKHLVPTSVKRHDTDNPTWRSLFKYIAPHDSFYEVHFNKTTPDDQAVFAEKGKPIHLIIAGAPGHVRLSWTLP
jgi:hypothetical protein